MKFFQKTWVAVILTITMIATGLYVGHARGQSTSLPSGTAAALDSNLSTSQYKNWISDEANVLSSQTEEAIALYNANWDEKYNSLIAVATVNGTDGQSISDYATTLANQIGLGSGDGLLVMDVDGEDAFFVTGDSFSSMLSSSQSSNYLNSYLYDHVMAGQYDDGVLSLFKAFNSLYYDTFGTGNNTATGNWMSPIFSLIPMIILGLLIFTMLDKRRYRTYQRANYGNPNPSVPFRSLFFLMGMNSLFGRLGRHHRYGRYGRHGGFGPSGPDGFDSSDRGSGFGGFGRFGGFGGFGGFGRGGGFGGGGNRGGGF